MKTHIAEAKRQIERNGWYARYTKLTRFCSLEFLQSGKLTDLDTSEFEDKDTVHKLYTEYIGATNSEEKYLVAIFQKCLRRFYGLSFVGIRRNPGKDSYSIDLGYHSDPVVVACHATIRTRNQSIATKDQIIADNAQLINALNQRIAAIEGEFAAVTKERDYARRGSGVAKSCSARNKLANKNFIRAAKLKDNIQVAWNSYPTPHRVHGVNAAKIAWTNWTNKTRLSNLNKCAVRSYLLTLLGELFGGELTQAELWTITSDENIN